MREAEEPERLRLAETPLCPLLSGEPPKPDQARLLGVQLQAELREPVAKVRPEPLGIIAMLESHHEVVSETRDDNVTARVPSSPLVSPQVKDVVQVDVRQAAVRPKPPYEQRWVMRSAGLKFPQRAGLTAERCA